MNIIDKKNSQTVNFKDICIGECFKYCGDYFLRIEELDTKVLDSINAVNVADGITSAFDDDDEVVLADFVVSSQ